MKQPLNTLQIQIQQVLAKLDLSDVDLISFAPHKFYGLNGFGGLIKKKDIVLEPLIMVVQVYNIKLNKKLRENL